jgi:hypothetical protein
MDKVKSVLQQSPDGVTEDMVNLLLKKHDGNVVDVLTELWNVDTDKVMNIDMEKQKWNDIRDICSSYEQEMHEYMEAMRGNASTKQ